MDPDDGKELSLMYRFETERQQHIEEYGSFLYCPKHGNLCCYMENVWETGKDCGRMPCIVEDPEHKKLQERIRRNVARRQGKTKEEKQDNIRRQTKTWEERQLEKIHRLEAESRKAYKRNRPKVGEDKLHQAIMLRAELRRKKEE